MKVRIGHLSSEVSPNEAAMMELLLSRQKPNTRQVVPGIQESFGKLIRPAKFRMKTKQR